jgi:hypothetical protein
VTTVEQVGIELGRRTAEVLAACRSLGIVASSGASGLSVDEQLRLREALGAPCDLDAPLAGSTSATPGGAEATTGGVSLEARAAALAGAGRRPRLQPRTVTRAGVWLFLVVAVAAAVVSLRDRADDETVVPAVQALTAADVGACVDLSGTGGQVTVVDCGQPHDAELYAVVDVADVGLAGAPGDAYPGREAVIDVAEDTCADRFGAHVGRAHAESSLDASFLVPTDATWSIGDRTIACLVEDPSGPLVGIVAGTGR